jgi:hypothetical protein
MSSRASRILWPVIWTALAIAALAVLLVLNDTAREVAKDTAVTLFAIFTTPFIFETMVAIIGIFVVLTVYPNKSHTFKCRNKRRIGTLQRCIHQRDTFRIVYGLTTSHLGCNKQQKQDS